MSKTAGKLTSRTGQRDFAFEGNSFSQEFPANSVSVLRIKMPVV